MGSTIAEKILARVSGQALVRPGDNLRVRPDFVVSYDFPGYTDVIFKQMKEEFGMSGVKDPSRYALFIDHMVPAITGGQRAGLCHARRLRGAFRWAYLAARHLRHPGHRRAPASGRGLRQ